jgi:hypothetical protein
MGKLDSNVQSPTVRQQVEDLLVVHLGVAAQS